MPKIIAIGKRIRGVTTVKYIRPIKEPYSPRRRTLDPWPMVGLGLYALSAIMAVLGLYGLASLWS